MKSICIINASRVDFDGCINISKLESIKDKTGASVSVSQCRNGSPTPAEISELANGHNILVTKEVTVEVESLPSSVELICEAGTGYNNIDIEAAAKKGITVCNVPSYSTEAVAQLVITFLLSMSASLTQQTNALVRGERHFFQDALRVPHFELSGKVLGLVGGTGSIGKRVAEIAKVLGMEVVVWSRSATDCDLWRAVSLDQLLSESDFVSLHCPLTAATTKLIDEKAISKMKSSSYIINTARGAIIDEPALIDALQKNRIAGAALDVQFPEPPVSESPLYSLNNVIITPHIGWKRLETRQRLMDTVAENIQEYLNGNSQNVIS